MSCLINSGYITTCADLEKAAGGVKQRIFIGNVLEIDRKVAQKGFNVNGFGYYIGINFLQYGKLYQFTGIKDGNDANDDIQRVESSGNVNFLHNVSFKMYDQDPSDRISLSNLIKADVYIIIETANGSFEIFGKDRGLRVQSAPKIRGARADVDTSRIITFEGSEPEPPVFFQANDGSYASTLNLLESYTD